MDSVPYVKAGSNTESDYAGVSGEQGKDGASFIDRHISNFFDGTNKLAVVKAFIPMKVLFGAGVLLGGTLATFMPKYAAFLVAGCFLIPPTVSTLLQTFKVCRNPHLDRVITHRVTAQVEGDFCVFLIGVRNNAPFKLTKEFSEIGDAFVSMIKELESQPMESSGFLGAENFVGANQQRSSHILTVMYWRSYDQLVDFARNRNMKHFPVWMNVIKALKKSPDLGVWHEAYQVAAGKYDTIYVNCPPMGLGMCANLVPAEGHLKSSRGRMGASDGKDVPPEVLARESAE